LVGFILLEVGGGEGTLELCYCSTIMEYEKLDAAKYKVYRYELTVNGDSPTVCELQYHEPTYVSTVGTMTVPFPVTIPGLMQIVHIPV
jgi:hypothetical protein